MYLARLTTGARRILVQQRAKLVQRKQKLSSDHHQVVPEACKPYVDRHMDTTYPLPTLAYSEVYAARRAKANKWLAISLVGYLASVALLIGSEACDYLAPPSKEVLIFKEFEE